MFQLNHCMRLWSTHIKEVKRIKSKLIAELTNFFDAKSLLKLGFYSFPSNAVINQKIVYPRIWTNSNNSWWVLKKSAGFPKVRIPSERGCGFPIHFKWQGSILLRNGYIQKVYFAFVFMLYSELNIRVYFIEFVYHGLKLACGSIENDKGVVNVSTIEEDLILVDTVGQNMSSFKFIHKKVC